MGSSGKASLMKTHLSAPASCSFLSRRLSMKSSKSSGSLVIVEGCRQSCLMMGAFPPACSMFHQKSIDFNVAILSCHVQSCCTCIGVLFNEESIDFNVAVCSCYPESCCTVMGALVLISSVFNQQSNDFNVPICSCHVQWCSNIIGALVLVCPVFSQESNNFSVNMCCCHPERCCSEVLWFLCRSCPTKNRTISSWPYAAATQKGVAPSWALLFLSAPSSTKNQTISVWPCAVATQRGVSPTWLLLSFSASRVLLTSASCSTKKRTASS